MSQTSPCASGQPSSTPCADRRASSAPSITQSLRPVLSSTSAWKAGPSSASRTAAVATDGLGRGPCHGPAAQSASARRGRAGLPSGCSRPVSARPLPEAAHDLFVVEIGGAAGGAVEDHHPHRVRADIDHANPARVRGRRGRRTAGGKETLSSTAKSVFFFIFSPWQRRGESHRTFSLYLPRAKAARLSHLWSCGMSDRAGSAASGWKGGHSTRTGYKEFGGRAALACRSSGVLFKGACQLRHILGARRAAPGQRGVFHEEAVAVEELPSSSGQVAQIEAIGARTQLCASSAGWRP
jgi:hypothetical protein